MIAAMAFVDAVCLFDEDTPKSLIEKISPDILTKGSDYTPENIVGADFVMAKGGEVKTIDLVEGFSTSKIIDKIKSFL
jgi:bifunctional ADP-heptose synthase (sugar kinase/adenylyltransferase)